MKTVKQDKEDGNFPRLMIWESDGTIILATGKDGEGHFIGTIVHASNPTKIGHHSEQFNRNFVPYSGSVTLSND